MKDVNFVKVQGIPVKVERGPSNYWRIQVGSKVTGVRDDNPRRVMEFARRESEKLLRKHGEAQR